MYRTGIGYRMETPGRKMKKKKIELHILILYFNVQMKDVI